MSDDGGDGDGDCVGCARTRILYFCLSIFRFDFAFRRARERERDPRGGGGGCEEDATQAGRCLSRSVAGHSCPQLPYPPCLPSPLLRPVTLWHLVSHLVIGLAAVVAVAADEAAARRRRDVRLRLLLFYVLFFVFCTNFCKNLLKCARYTHATLVPGKREQEQQHTSHTLSHTHHASFWAAHVPREIPRYKDTTHIPCSYTQSYLKIYLHI